MGPYFGPLGILGDSQSSGLLAFSLSSLGLGAQGSSWSLGCRNLEFRTYGLGCLGLGFRVCGP